MGSLSMIRFLWYIFVLILLRTLPLEFLREMDCIVLEFECETR